MKFGNISMKATLVLLVACTHIGFLFFAYSTSVFGLALPYMLKIAIWLGCSSLAAGVAYYMVYSSYPVFGAKMPRVICAFVSAGISLYVGVFLAFNVLGT